MKGRFQVPEYLEEIFLAKVASSKGDFALGRSSGPMGVAFLWEGVESYFQRWKIYMVLIYGLVFFVQATE